MLLFRINMRRTSFQNKEVHHMGTFFNVKEHMGCYITANIEGS